MMKDKENESTFDVEEKAKDGLIKELQERLSELEAQSEELRVAKLSAERARDKYIEFYEHAPVGYFTISRDSFIGEANFIGAALLGVDRSELFNQRFRRFVALSDIDRWDEYFLSVCQQDKQRGCDLLLMRADGSTFYAHLEGHRFALTAIKGRVSEYVVHMVVVDITEHRPIESALKKEENKYKTLVDNLPQSIFIKDINSIYKMCNGNYARDLKIEAKDIVGKTDYDFYPKDLAEKYRADDKRVMEAGKTEDIEERYIKNSQERFVHTVKVPIRDEQGKIAGVLGIFWDITKDRQAEEADCKRIKELEIFYKASINREQRIIELKAENEALKKESHEKK